VELANLIGKTIASKKQLQAMMGTPIEVKRFWLDFDYPYVAPPQYERTG
jgi:hypothetical protein